MGDLSNNPDILANIEIPSWHHVEGLEEMKLIGCGVTVRQLMAFMMAVPTSIKRLDLSKNPDILANSGEVGLLTWHHVEGLEEMKLAGCGVTASPQLNELLFAVPEYIGRLDLSRNPEILANTEAYMEVGGIMKLVGCHEILRDGSFNEDATLPGRWCRTVARPPKGYPNILTRCVLC